MRPEPKKRIDTQAAQTPLGGLGDALSGIEIPNLPVAETAAESSSNHKHNNAPAAKEAPLWKLGRVVLRREKAHRGGKTVIVVDDFATHLPLSVIESTARKVRAACGCGGTMKDRRIEIQGDQPAKVRAALEAEGYQVAGVR